VEREEEGETMPEEGVKEGVDEGSVRGESERQLMMDDDGMMGGGVGEQSAPLHGPSIQHQHSQFTNRHCRSVLGPLRREEG